MDSRCQMEEELITSSPPQQQIQNRNRSQKRLSWDAISSKIDALSRKTCESYRAKPGSYWALLSLSCLAMLVAFPASSLLSRLYFQNGGTSKWIISWVAVAGWPIPALILVPTYLFSKTTPTPLGWGLSASYAGLGFLSAADNLMYAYAYAYLPASTAALIASSSLVFSALFGYLIVSNAMNASVVNSVVVVTAALTIIALDSDSDRYSYVTEAQYAMGLVWDVLASALHGLIFALSELVFVKQLGRRSFHVVLEQQVTVSALAFTFTTVGMVVSGGFSGMGAEAREFKGGPGAYWMVIVWGVVTFQLGVLGATAAVFLGSTVLAGVLNAVRVPVTAIAAVILMKDPMSGFKILSLVVTFWGFGCYIYGSSDGNKGSSNGSNSSSSPQRHVVSSVI